MSVAPTPCRAFPCEPQPQTVSCVPCEGLHDSALCDIIGILCLNSKDARTQSDSLVDAFRERPAGALDHVSGACDRFVSNPGRQVDNAELRLESPLPTWATAPLTLNAQPFVVVVPGEDSMKHRIHAVMTSSVPPPQLLRSLHIEAVSADDTEEFVSWVRTSDARPHVVFMTDLAVRRWGVSSDVASLIYVMSMTYPRGRALGALLAQYLGAHGGGSHGHSHYCTAPPPMEGGSDAARAVDLIPECIERVQTSAGAHGFARSAEPVTVCFAAATEDAHWLFKHDVEALGYTVKDFDMAFFDNAW